MKLKFNHQNIYFTADLHLGHANIMKYCNRPYITLNQMDADIINSLNEIASGNSVLFLIGDIMFKFISDDAKNAFKRALMQFSTVYCLRGNHDHNQSIKYLKSINSVQFLNDSIVEVSIEDDEMEQDARIILCHYPLLSWNASYHGSWHLFGHVHGVLQHPSFNALDVGVDCHEYKPVSYSQVKEIITRQNLTKKHLYGTIQ